MRRIDVLLVDDHSVVRAGYRMLLSQSKAIGRIHEADGGESACRIYAETRPDIVVMDISMPGIGGLNAIRRICSREPDARILVFSIHEEPIYVAKALEAGAKGYLTKRSAPDVLVEAVMKMAQGESYIEQTLREDGSREGRPIESPAVRVDLLSRREFDVFLALASGLTAREVAGQLCLSYKTVANYSTSIKTKLKVNTGAELAKIALDLGLVPR
jgi:two-component system, NarL family, invasion response regulator UvrY